MPNVIKYILVLAGLTQTETGKDLWSNAAEATPLAVGTGHRYYLRAEMYAQRALAWGAAGIVVLFALALVPVHEAVLLMSFLLPGVAVKHVLQARALVAVLAVRAAASHLPNPLKKIENLYRVVFTLMALQALLTLMLWVIPLENDRMLLLPLLVAVMGFMFALAGVQNKYGKNIRTVFVLFMIGIVLVLFMGGRGGIEERREAKEAEQQERVERRVQTQRSIPPLATETRAAPPPATPDTPEPEAHHLPEAEPSLSALFQQHGTVSGVRKYSVTVVNHGEGEARNVVIEQKLPDDIHFTDGSRAKEWKVDSIEPGHSVEFLADIDISDSPVGSTYTTVISVDADNYNGFHFKEVVEDA